MSSRRSFRLSFHQMAMASKSKTAKPEPSSPKVTTRTLQPQKQQKPPPRTLLHHLPTEIFLAILSSLTVKDISSLVLTCTNLNQRLNGELWHRGLNLSSPLPAGTVLMQRASQCGWEGTLRKLLEVYHISPNILLQDLSALHWTCNHIFYRSTQLLLSHGANIEGGTSTCTPLHYAAYAGNAAAGVIRLLLSHGANINATVQDEGKTALHIAAKSGYGGVVVMLLQYGADMELVDNTGFTPLHHAARYGFVRIVNLLLEAGASPNPRQSYCLLFGRLTPVRSPLRTALYHRQLAVVEALIQGGADQTEEMDAPSRSLLTRCKMRLTHELNGISPQPLLHAAVRDNNLGAVKALCGYSSGAVDLEERHDGSTALSLAARLGFSEVVEELLRSGANWEARDAAGHTPAEAAYRNAHKAVGDAIEKWLESVRP